MLDIIGATLLIVFFIRGFRKGLIVALVSFLALLLGMVLAIKLSGALALYLFDKGWVSSGWASVLSYVIIFVGVGYLIRLGGRVMDRAADAVLLGLFNRLAGGALFAFAAAFVWSGLLLLADKVGMFSPEAKEASVTYAFFEPIAPWVLANMGAVLPFIKSMMQELQTLSDHLSDNISQPGVGTH